MEQSQELMEAREEIKAMKARARAAQEQIADYTQEQVATGWVPATQDRP